MSAAKKRGGTTERTTASARAKAGSVRKSTKRPARPESTATRNQRNDKNRATYALEESNPQKAPSRKSTRRASNRAKPDSNLKRRQTRRVRSPASRAQARAG